MSEASTTGESPSSARQVQVDEQQQIRIQRYIRVVTLIMLLVVFIAIGISVPVILFTGSILSGISANPWLAWQPVQGWYPLQILVFYVLGSILIGAFLYLFSFLTGYILPRRYQLNTRTSTFSAWAMRWLRLNGRRFYTWLLLLQCCFLCIAIQPLLWWLWMAILLTLVLLILTYLGPSYAFRHMKRTLLSDDRLVAMLKELCVQNKTSIQHFFVLASKKPGELVRANAYFAGWGKTSSILLTDGLLKHFQFAEIKVVVAHELGHHVYRHLVKRQVLNFCLLLPELFLYSLLYHWFYAFSSLLSFDDTTTLILLFFCLIGLEVRLGFFILRRKYRRNCEFWADEFSLCATRNVPVFKNAMLRLGNLNDIPLKLTPRQERGLTHPTTARRLEHADEFALRLAQAREASRSDP